MYNVCGNNFNNIYNILNNLNSQCPTLHLVEGMYTTKRLHHNSILGTAYVDVKPTRGYSQRQNGDGTLTSRLAQKNT